MNKVIVLKPKLSGSNSLDMVCLYFKLDNLELKIFINQFKCYLLNIFNTNGMCFKKPPTLA